MSSDFYVCTHPTARKPHLCLMCRRRIDVGEKYRRGAGMDGSTAWTTRPLLLLTIAILLCAVSPVASGAWLAGVGLAVVGVWRAGRAA